MISPVVLTLLILKRFMKVILYSLNMTQFQKLKIVIFISHLQNAMNKKKIVRLVIFIILYKDIFFMEITFSVGK